jgi:hypothetical protein
MNTNKVEAAIHDTRTYMRTAWHAMVAVAVPAAPKYVDGLADTRPANIISRVAIDAGVSASVSGTAGQELQHEPVERQDSSHADHVRTVQ